MARRSSCRPANPRRARARRSGRRGCSDARTVEPVRESGCPFARVVAAGSAIRLPRMSVMDAKAQREEQQTGRGRRGSTSVQPEIQHVAMRLQHALGLAGRPSGRGVLRRPARRSARRQVRA
jgi:hypothetical protein